MPGGMTGGYKNLVGGSDLVRALDAGEVKIERINDGITRLLAQWYLRGQDKGYPTVSYKDGYQNTIYNGSVVNEHRDVQGDHWKIVKEIGEEAVTLIYNKRSNAAGPRHTPTSDLVCLSAKSLASPCLVAMPVQTRTHQRLSVVDWSRISALPCQRDFEWHASRWLGLWRRLLPLPHRPSRWDL